MSRQLRQSPGRGPVAAIAVLVATAAVAQEPRPTPSPAGPTFPAGVDVVTVDAVVLDSDGNPIEGLTRGDFRILEDGEPQAVTTFEAIALHESAPQASSTRSRVSSNLVRSPRPERSFVIVFDNVHMAPERADRAKRAVEEFLEQGLAPGDQVTLIPTAGGAWWSGQVPDDVPDLLAAMGRLEGERRENRSVDRISDWEAMRLYLYRDKTVGAQVARRYYNYAIIPEPAWPTDETSRELTDIGDTHPLLRIKATEVYLNARSRQQATLKALQRAAEALGSARGRKSLLLVSEGFIHDSQMGGFREVLEAARRGNVAINFIDVRGLDTLPVHADAEISEPLQEDEIGTSLNEPVRSSQGAVSIAADTGGAVLKNRNDLAAAMTQVAEQSRAYYLIGYQPSNPKADGKFRKIEVKVDRPGVTVRARKGYYAPDASGKQPQLDEDDLDPRVRRAIDSPFDGDAIPLRLTSFVLGPAADGKAGVLLAAEADPAAFDFVEDPKTSRYEDALETFVLISSRDTGENFHREKLVELSLPAQVRDQLKASWLPVVRDFQLAPGVYQARLMVRERNGGRIGTVRHEFEVPTPEGLRTSTPILTNVVEPPPEGSQLPPRPVPMAHRAFPQGDRLYYLFEVYGAQTAPGSTSPDVTVGYVVHGEGGSVLSRMDPRPLTAGPQGQLSQLLAFSLQNARPGPYEVVLTVQDRVAGTQLEVRDPFQVVARPNTGD